MSGKRFALILAVILVALTLAPYSLASLTGSETWRFSGFLINPVDGYSYLAKMQQGALGSWRFRLPYTAETGEGGYLFLLYLGLGHLARILNLPLVTVFHGARLFGGILLVWSLYLLADHSFSKKRDKNLALLITAAGSGLGWLAIFFGMFTSDFWVAEAFPFLSFYTNPHFPLGAALMILAILPRGQHPSLRGLLLGVALGIVQPFGVVIVGLVKVAELLDWGMQNRVINKEFFREARMGSLLGFGLGGGSVLLYQFWTILSDPVLAAWHSQNQTPTPAILDLLISFSPCLIMAFFGFKEAWQSRAGKVLLFWGGISLLLVFVPWNLQRRFLTGIFIPLAFLSVWGLKWLAEKLPQGRKFWTAILLILALPTNLIVVASGIQAAIRNDPQVYISGELDAGMAWLRENTRQNALVLAEEDVGLIIPAATGRRVVYGHPFETTNAADQLEFVERFFYGQLEPAEYRAALAEREVEFVVITEQVSPGLVTWLELNWAPVFERGALRIFQEGEQ